MTTARDAAEAARVRAKLHLSNAVIHATDVSGRFGRHSQEYAIAWKVLEEARRETVAAYDRILELDRREVKP